MSGKTLAPNTITVVPLTGQTDFTIPFDYLARKYVVLTLLGRDRKVLTLNMDYRFISKTVVSLTNLTPAGYDKLEIRRETSATERLVDFHDGSILRAYDLNLSQVQTLHVAEEARDLTADTIGVNDDGDLDARGRKIVNLGAGLRGTTDAANMLQLDEYDNSTLQNRDQAIQAKEDAYYARDVAIANANISIDHAKQSIASATQSEESAQRSHTSETNSANSAAESEASYQKIVPLEQSTVENAAKAKTEADRAKTEADRAKTEADKLGSMNDFASIINSVDVPNKRPSFKGGISVGAEFNDNNRQAPIIECIRHVDGVPRRVGYVGTPTYDRNLFMVAEEGRLELQGTQGGVGIVGKSGDINISSDNSIIHEAGNVEVRNAESFRILSNHANSEGGRLELSYPKDWSKFWMIDVGTNQQLRFVAEGRVPLYINPHGGDNSVEINGNLTVVGGGSVGRLQYDGNVIGPSYWGGNLVYHLSQLARKPVWQRMSGDSLAGVGGRWMLYQSVFNRTVRFYVPHNGVYVTGEAPEGDGIKFSVSNGPWVWHFHLEYGGTHMVMVDAGAGAQPILNVFAKSYEY